MPRQNTISDIAKYHKDAEESLRLYFSTDNPAYTARFATYVKSEVLTELKYRLTETDLQSVLTLLAFTEAAFRIDYQLRSKKKLSDPISEQFRRIWRRKNVRTHFENDILDTWRASVDPAIGAYISSLKGYFKFRHWLAHGRHWQFAPNGTFQDVYLVVDNLFSALNLQS